MKRIVYVPDFDQLESQCVGCRLCEMMCSLSRTGACNPSLSRVRVVSWEPSNDVPVLCHQCADAPCQSACPVGAIIAGEAGAICVSQDECIGCGECVTVCPFGAMGFDSATMKAFKCDLCGGKPACIEFCPSQVLKETTTSALVSELRLAGARQIQEAYSLSRRKSAAHNGGGSSR